MTRKRYLDFMLSAFPDPLHRRTCLYVGAHPGKEGKGRSFWDEIRYAGYRMTVVEAFPENCTALESELVNGEEIVLSDIRTWESPRKYDLVIWWHGPEHIPAADIPPTLKKLKSLSCGFTVVGAPWGDCKQGVAYGNEFERHLSVIDKKVLLDAGFTVQVSGKKGVIENGQIMGWCK